jgi:lipid A 4'-phosphatase
MPKSMPLQNPHPLLSYLKLRRTRVILGSFLAVSLLLATIPGIDLGISRLFFDGGFYMADQGWAKFFHSSVSWFLYASVAVIGFIYVFNRLSGRQIWGIDGRKVVYLLLVLAIGAGLIVNELLKEEFGRARPKNIVVFGGTADFTPAYVISANCSHNCSFSSGDSAGAFFSLAFIFVASRRRPIAATAVAYGVLVSAARIVSGSHFFSDTVVSFYIMLIVSDALYYRMFVFEPASAESMSRLPIAAERR